MEQPRILIIGKTGQVGWELRRTLAPMARIVSTDFPEIDLSNNDSIRQCVRNATPNVVINAAAFTAVDKAESQPELASQINGIAPGIIAAETKQLGALMVHFSTDYVFDGTKSGPYVETDTPNPMSVYGRSKLEGDNAVRNSAGPHLIFRLSWVYGARGQNFMLTIMRLARERPTLRVVNDQVGCPTPSRMIAQTVALALGKVLAAKDPNAFSGLYHLASVGATSWHGFAQAIVESMPADQKRCTQIEAISTPEYPLPAKRPASSVLGCAKLQTVFGLALPDWREGLAQVLEP